MKLSYQYVVLRCVPRVDREEFVNVGVVLYCEAADYLDVRWHVDAARLRALDPQVDVDQVSESLTFVDGVCAGDERGERPPARRWASASGSSRRRAAPCSSPARCTVASPPTRPASSSTSSSASSADPCAPRAGQTGTSSTAPTA